MLPKKIHYIWFGRQPKNDLIKACISSWKRYMPDFEIIEWNEDNTDLARSEFAREAGRMKQWAFVSDYVRFKVLAEEGGLYMDTDVELLKRIPEDILEHAPFTGAEFSGLVAPGLLYACEAGEPTAVYMKEYYEKAVFKEKELVTVNEILTNYLKGKGFAVSQKIQQAGGLTIYPWDYFCSYDQDIKEILLTSNSVSIHHYRASWKKTGLKKRCQLLLKRMIGRERYRFLLGLKRRLSDAIRG